METSGITKRQLFPVVRSKANSLLSTLIPAGRVYRAPDMLEDPHFKAREAIIEVETRTRGKLKMQNAFPKLSRTPSGVRRPAPDVPGQDNAEVLGELLGYGPDKLETMNANGVI